MKNYLSLGCITFILLLALYFLPDFWITLFGWLPQPWAVAMGLAVAAGCSSGVAMLYRKEQ